jgi:hypothetical protein
VPAVVASDDPSVEPGLPLGDDDADELDDDEQPVAKAAIKARTAALLAADTRTI